MTPDSPYSIRWLPIFLSALCFAVCLSCPAIHMQPAAIIWHAFIHLLILSASIRLYAAFCKRCFHHKWVIIFAPLLLLLIPLPMYGILYTLGEWSEHPLLELMGGDGVFNLASWAFALMLAALGMIYSGNALLKNAPDFPRSQIVSLLCSLTSLSFGLIFIGSLISTSTSRETWVLYLTLPFALPLILIPLSRCCPSLRKRITE